MRWHGQPEVARAFADTALVLIRALREDSLLPQPVAESATGEALLERGDYAESQAGFLDLLEKQPQHVRAVTHAGIAAAFAGDTTTALDMLRRLDANVASRGDTAWRAFRQARILAALGRKDQAVANLRVAVAFGLTAAENFHADIAFERLRGYPTFETLVRPRK